MLEVKRVSTEENKQVAERVFEEIINKGNFEATNELVAEDYRLNEPTGLPPGREGLRTLTQAYRNGFPDIRMSVEDMIGEEDQVAVRWSASGTHRGEFMGIPPSGQKVEVKGITWLRFKEGKVAEEWTETTSLAMPR